MHLSRIIRFAAWACVALVAVLSLTPSAHIERTVRRQGFPDK